MEETKPSNQEAKIEPEKAINGTKDSKQDGTETKANGSTAEAKVQSPEKKLAEQSTSESGKKVQDPMPEDEDD